MTPQAAITAAVETLSTDLIALIVSILPAIFSVVVVIVGLNVGYRLFRRMISR